MIKLNSAELLFEKQPLYHVLTSKSISNAKESRVIIVYQFEGKELPAPIQEMLEKLVAACKYKPEDATYINIEVTQGVSIGDLKTAYSPEAIMIFGEVAISRNLPKVKKNVPYELNGVKLIHAEAVDKLNANPKEKAALWGGLQKMMAM